MEQLFLSRLSLLGFKNYDHVDLTFSPRFNCILGNNGEGKTNLLDAIHYLSVTKSYFNPIDSHNILYNAPLFVIQGQFQAAGKADEVYCAQKRGEKKQVKINKNEVVRFADHIGLFPVVFASPTDTELILGGSEIRRKFTDSIISQYNHAYLEDVIAYTKALSQRNAQLKHFAKGAKFDLESVKIWDVQLIEFGTRISRQRQEFSEKFVPIFQKYYELISGGREKVSMRYQSQLQNGDFEAQLNEVIEKDRAMEFTTVGVHKDDLEFSMLDFPVKKFASQGQQKSYLLAIKLAQFAFIKQHKNIIPILLLDDIHDKLDEQRVRRLIELVSTDDFGQVFITDTGSDQVLKLFNGINAAIKILTVKDGTVTG